LVSGFNSFFPVWGCAVSSCCSGLGLSEAERRNLRGRELGSRKNKKRSKHHVKCYAQKRKKRIKQKFYSKFLLPIAKARKEAHKETSEKLKKGLKRLEVQSEKTHKSQRKGKTK